MSVLWAPRRLGVALSASARRGGALADLQRLWRCFLARFGRLLTWARRGGAIVNFEAVLSDMFVFYGIFSDLVNSCRDCCFTYFVENFKFPIFLDVGVFTVFKFHFFFDVVSVLGMDVESVGMRFFDNLLLTRLSRSRRRTSREALSRTSCFTTFPLPGRKSRFGPLSTSRSTRTRS